MKKPNHAFLVLFLILITPFQSSAWGRRGHQVVGENAAILVSGEPEAKFMREHSYDFGYYANVPDFIWKRPATYDMEKTNHFMDMEIYDRELPKHPEIKEPLAMSRKDFDAAFPELKQTAGRSFWRIRELYTRLEKVTSELREMKEITGEPRRKLQERWFLLAGVIAHYVGDLGMPLHVSENYDGMMTNQKGVHAHFEEVAVDQIYPDVDSAVNHEAIKQWPAFSKKNRDKTVLQLITDLAERSKNEIPKLLAIDKKTKREDLKAVATAFKPMIVRQMTDSTLVLAELYRRQLGWKFDSDKFYYFAGEPEYIAPGEPGEPVTPPPVLKK